MERATTFLICQRPIWAQFRFLKALFTDLSRERLNGWVNQGWVRCRKNGNDPRAAVAYSIDDIDAVYDAEARGKRPKRV